MEKVSSTDDADHPRCVGGRRACPPEDSGGIWGYTELCAILADPTHPEHAARREWLGDDYDPLAFDVESVDRALGGLRVR